jgi:pyruvate dehydrogenase E1 component
LKGLYRFRESPAAGDGADDRPPVQLLGSGPLLNEALRAQQILAERFGVAAEVWSATSYKELRREALEVERWNRLHPGEQPRVPYVTLALHGAEGPVVAVTDYLSLVPDQIARWVPNGLTSLGTDGFGRSDTRHALRRFFEVDAEHVAVAALERLAAAGTIDRSRVAGAIAELGLDPELPPPVGR